MAGKVPMLLLSKVKESDVPSTPRRRLANALEAARELQIESIQNVVEMEEGLQTGRVDKEEKVVTRFGKKLCVLYRATPKWVGHGASHRSRGWSRCVRPIRSLSPAQRFPTPLAP